jgi:CheY-like chemotaxis protein
LRQPPNLRSLRTVARARSSTVNPSEPGVSKESGLRRRVVLVVEDDADLRNELAELLAEVGYRVHACANGAEALAQLEQAPPPSIILLDLMLPVMNGWNFFSAIRDDPRLAHVPVVVMSTGERLASAPVSTAYLEKPITREVLLEALARSLERAARA